jgi:hypothetical protein
VLVCGKVERPQFNTKLDTGLLDDPLVLRACKAAGFSPDVVSDLIKEMVSPYIILADYYMFS